MNEEIDRIVELEIDLDDVQLEEMGVDVVSFVYEPAIEVDFLAFNKEEEVLTYVDESGFEGFREWIYNNQELFKKPGGGAAGDGGVNHGQQMRVLSEAGINTEFPFGYCFQVAQFLFYAVGGYESDWDLKCIKKMEYVVEGRNFSSTHWYIQNSKTGQLVDLTAQQFDGILNIEEYYSEGRRANLGFPYYNVSGKKVEFENTVPSIQTLKLYDRYREDIGQIEELEKYYKAAKYEELRKEFEMQFAKELFVYPTAGESESDFISRCIPVVIDEGYEVDQATAICYSYWESEQFNQDLNILGFVPSHFDICPAATNLFEHLVTMQPDEETKGMIRSAALQADKIFEIEKKVLQLQEATERDVRQASLLANDFVDLMREIDEELEMSHNISWMMGHIETIASYYKGTEEFLPENPCQDGWVAYGMKTKDGRQVPNCIPVENEMEFQSYNDYPESARNAAKRALEWRDSHPENTCGTRVGWARANQLAKGENISEETIARMASFARHLQYKDVPYSEGCGGLMVDAWGGQAGIEWAQNKLQSIREESSYDPSGLSPYIDYGDDLRRKEFADECHVMSTEEEEIILKWAEEHGEHITQDYTFINPKEEFNTIGDIAKAITGLDILGKMGIRKDEPAEVKYKYEGPSAERGFCKAMLRLNKLYSEDDMSALESRLATINPGMGPNGRNSYNVFSYKGGVNCRHYWTKNALFKPEGSREVLIINQGPAEGDAGRSNNSNRPSPSGSVDNNASLRRRNFSFSIEDDEKRIVAGPLMVPNQFIMRRDENGEPYYVFFSKDTIKRIQERFNKKKNHNITDLDHDGNIIEDNILLEQWIVESRQYDKSRYYGFDNMPLGSWFGVYKVNDDKTWERIKKGELRGFSIAGDFINKAKPVKNEEEELMDKIINILGQVR